MSAGKCDGDADALVPSAPPPAIRFSLEYGSQWVRDDGSCDLVLEDAVAVFKRPPLMVNMALKARTCEPAVAGALPKLYLVLRRQVLERVCWIAFGCFSFTENQLAVSKQEAVDLVAKAVVMFQDKAMVDADAQFEYPLLREVRSQLEGRARDRVAWISEHVIDPLGPFLTHCPHNN